MDWDGAKLAVLSGGRILSLLRDHRDDIPFPGEWDLPGGGREGRESEVECVLRETREETGLTLEPRWIVWKRAYPGAGGVSRWFLVAVVPPDDIGEVRLGDEGQAVRWFGINAFLQMDGAISHLQDRLRDYLTDRARHDSNAHL